MSVEHLIEGVSVFDGPAPEYFSWVKDREGWPYMSIDVGGGIYTGILDIGNYIERVARLSFPDIRFVGNCRVGYRLRENPDGISQRDLFFVKVSLLPGDLEARGRSFLLMPENPSKEMVRLYRDQIKKNLGVPSEAEA